MIGVIPLVLGISVAITAGVSGFVLFKKIATRKLDEEQRKRNEQWRNAFGYALEVFQPFYWETLHFAILSQDFVRKNDSEVEENDSAKTKLINAYLTSLTSVQLEFKNLDAKLDVPEIRYIQDALKLDMREAVGKIIRMLVEACRIAQHETDLTECFRLVQVAYKECAQTEKVLRSMFRRTLISLPTSKPKLL